MKTLRVSLLFGVGIFAALAHFDARWYLPAGLALFTLVAWEGADES